MEIIIPQVQGKNTLKIKGFIEKYEISMNIREINSCLIEISLAEISAVEDDKSIVVQIDDCLFLSEVHCKSLTMREGLVVLELLNFSLYPSEEHALADIMGRKLKESNREDKEKIEASSDTFTLSSIDLNSFTAGDTICINEGT